MFNLDSGKTNHPAPLLRLTFLGCVSLISSSQINVQYFFLQQSSQFVNLSMQISLPHFVFIYLAMVGVSSKNLTSLTFAVAVTSWPVCFKKNLIANFHCAIGRNFFIDHLLSTVFSPDIIKLKNGCLKIAMCFT